MVVIEMRDETYNTAFDLLEEAKESAKKTKLTLCDLEDAMYDCYESSKEEHYEDEEPEMDFRKNKDYRHDDMYDEDEREDMHYRRARRMGNRMRMRRNRMGRFV